MISLNLLISARGLLTTVLLQEGLAIILYLYSKNTLQGTRDLLFCVQCKLIVEVFYAGLTSFVYDGREPNEPISRILERVRIDYWKQAELTPYLDIFSKLTAILNYSLCVYSAFKCVFFEFHSEFVQGMLFTLSSGSCLLSYYVFESFSKDKAARDEEDVRQAFPVNDFVNLSIELGKPLVGLIGLNIGSLVVETLLALHIPQVYKKIFDLALERNDTPLYTSVLYLIMLELSSNIISAAATVLTHSIQSEVTSSLKEKVFNAVLYLKADNADEMNIEETLNMIGNDTQGMSIIWRLVLQNGSSHATKFLGATLVCWTISWKLTFLALSTLGPLGLFLQHYTNYVQHLQEDLHKFFIQVSGASHEALKHFPMVKIFSAEQFHYTKYLTANQSLIAAERKSTIASAAAYVFTDSLSLISRLLLVVVGSSSALSSVLATSDLIAFQLYWGMIEVAVGGIQQLFVELPSAMAMSTRVMKFLSMHENTTKEIGGKLLEKQDIRGAIVLDNVVFAYKQQPNKNVLQGISMVIEAGKVCAIVGRSGGGKSTILNVILRLHEPTSGDILLDGINVLDLNLKSYHQCVGVVPQSPTIFGGTILDNVTYGLESEKFTLAEVRNACRQAHIADFVEGLPLKYNTRIGSGGKRLSGGEGQRLALARVFLRKPAILILDEATSSLDNETERHVQDSINELVNESGCTALIVAHRLSTVQKANCIFAIEEGRVVESGTHAELIRNSGLYAKLASNQIGA